MPKAAFQYGMKMSDGRKTRGKIGQKNEKAKLDKEWNQVRSSYSLQQTAHKQIILNVFALLILIYFIDFCFNRQEKIRVRRRKFKQEAQI